MIFLRDADTAPASLALSTGRRAYLTFDYLACKLGEMPVEPWLDSDNLVARHNLPNMRSPHRLRVEVYAQAVRGLLALEPDSDRREKYIDFIDIYAALTENERRRYRQQYPEEGAAMIGMNQRAREEGVRQGRVEGERIVLERLLRRRFGIVSPDIAEKLSGASAAELETWAENILDAETPDDVFDSGS